MTDLTSQLATNSTSREADADKEASDALENGDKAKIDKTLDDLNVSTTDSGRDQSQDEDTEGSTSSSKNLDKQGG
ncbi:hypothetical protein [Caballeronia insecticola]|uniref:Uncharacterized protein n=1 Tax=Caballeronia insecticola TaxID=758793 RepID=R4X236_9BURK|nr:hypothetical protein [Caballeronia insecticola]BAN26496.1 hypothetical protein BRPE64_CCDS04130 [Caballeronia insecticola]